MGIEPILVLDVTTNISNEMFHNNLKFICSDWVELLFPEIPPWQHYDLFVYDQRPYIQNELRIFIGRNFFGTPFIQVGVEREVCFYDALSRMLNKFAPENGHKKEYWVVLKEKTNE